MRTTSKLISVCVATGCFAVSPYIVRKYLKVRGYVGCTSDKARSNGITEQATGSSVSKIDCEGAVFYMTPIDVDGDQVSARLLCKELDLIRSIIEVKDCYIRSARGPIQYGRDDASIWSL